MTQINRLAGGQVDQTKTLNFHFDGAAYRGHPGDTLASALLANGVRLMGRAVRLALLASVQCEHLLGEATNCG